MRDVLAVSVGFGLGILYSLPCGFETDPVDRPTEDAAHASNPAVSAATWTDGPWPFTIDRGELTCIGPRGRPGAYSL